MVLAKFLRKLGSLPAVRVSTNRSPMLFYANTLSVTVLHEVGTATATAAVGVVAARRNSVPGTAGRPRHKSLPGRYPRKKRQMFTNRRIVAQTKAWSIT